MMWIYLSMRPSYYPKLLRHTVKICFTAALYQLLRNLPHDTSVTVARHIQVNLLHHSVIYNVTCYLLPSHVTPAVAYGPQIVTCVASGPHMKSRFYFFHTASCRLSVTYKLGCYFASSHTFASIVFLLHIQKDVLLSSPTYRHFCYVPLLHTVTRYFPPSHTVISLSHRHLLCYFIHWVPSSSVSCVTVFFCHSEYVTFCCCIQLICIL